MAFSPRERQHLIRKLLEKQPVKAHSYPKRKKSQREVWDDLDRMLSLSNPVDVVLDLSQKSLRITFANGQGLNMLAGVPSQLWDVMDKLRQHFTTDLINLHLITKSGLTYTGFVTPVIIGGMSLTTTHMGSDLPTMAPTYPSSIFSHITEWIRSDATSLLSQKSGGPLQN